MTRGASWLGLVVVAVLLAGCGFQPLYGTRDTLRAAQQGFPDVQVALISDRLGQLLRNELLDRINPRGVNRDPRYRLEVSAKETRSDIVILRDDTATFAKFSVEAQWALVDAETNAPVTRGTAQRTASFLISESEFAVLQAEADARRRATTQLAEDIRLRLALYFQRAAG